MLQPHNSDDERFSVVYVTHIYEEAHIILGRLQAEGIPAFMQREAIANALGLSVGRLGEIKILVNESDYDAVMQILQPADTISPELESNNSNIIYHADDTEPDND